MSIAFLLAEQCVPQRSSVAAARCLQAAPSSTLCEPAGRRGGVMGTQGGCRSCSRGAEGAGHLPGRLRRAVDDLHGLHHASGAAGTAPAAPLTRGASRRGGARRSGGNEAGSRRRRAFDSIPIAYALSSGWPRPSQRHGAVAEDLFSDNLLCPKKQYLFTSSGKLYLTPSV